MKNKRNTDTVEVAQSTLVAARVLEHKPASVRPFESVRADIETMLAKGEGGHRRRARRRVRTGWPN